MNTKYLPHRGGNVLSVNGCIHRQHQYVITVVGVPGVPLQALPQREQIQYYGLIWICHHVVGIVLHWMILDIIRHVLLTIITKDVILTFLKNGCRTAR